MNHKRGVRALAHSSFGGSRTSARFKPASSRPARGNMLVFITACTIGLLAALAFFGLGYVRLLGSNNEQRTAIEAGSLAAARDLSMIAVNSNTGAAGSNYGWVSLSDYAPVTSSTIAGDQWDTPVRSINTILGTIRLDLIIADQIGDQNLETIIKQDLVTALAAQATLNAALQDAILPTPSKQYTDINGNNINVYQDAQNAYTANQIRMTGSSNYVAGSLVLTMGCVQNGSTTNIPIPSCGIGPAQVPSTSAQGNCYMSFVDIPYLDISGASTDFVFAGIGTNVKLVDPKQFTLTAQGLAPGVQYLSSIVQATASQHMNSSENPNGYIVQAIACAQPANVVDPRPAPGALSFSFPDGIPPEMTSPNSMMTDSGARIQNDGSAQAQCSYDYSSNGDFPVPNGSTPTVQPYAAWPYASLAQNTGNVFRQGLYDWWKRSGCRLNVASAVAMINGPATFTAPVPVMVDWKTQSSLSDPVIYDVDPVSPNGGIPNGNIHVYKVSPTTNQITYQTATIAPIQYAVAAQNQLYSENIGAIQPSTSGTLTVPPFTLPSSPTLAQTYYLEPSFDCYIRDQVYQPNSGAHCGEPMDCPTVSLGPVNELGAGGTGCHNRGTVPMGVGNPPTVVKQDDFGEGAFPYTNVYYYTYSTGPGTVRPTYQTNGMAVDIRYRRMVDTNAATASYLNFNSGYVGEKFGPSVPAIPALPPPTGWLPWSPNPGGPPGGPSGPPGLPGH